MAKTLYLECYSGISGDMTAAALLGLGADRQVLEQALASLPVQGFTTRIQQVVKSGIRAWDFEVILEEGYENHDHDMEYLHGKGEHTHGEPLHGAHSHGHEGHTHEGHTHSHPHEHRGLREIREIILAGRMTERAKETALRIFSVLAEAEAQAHGVPVEEVHFHEVGAVDSIADIVSVAVCLDNLDIDRVIVPELYEGRGYVRCQHGLLPVPVPAVANIAAKAKLKLHRTGTEGELVTPTGAAIAAAIRTSETLPESFVIEKTGIGAGKRTYDCPGILRAMLLREEDSGRDRICKLETNIDDSTGEMLGYVLERLFEAGALDVSYMPAFMKKNRPAWLLTVICKEEEAACLEQIIFRETTTIGIRRAEMERTVLPRETRRVDTPLGQVEVKVCRTGERDKYYPEYNSLTALCRQAGISYQEAYHMAAAAAEKEKL